MAHYEIEIKSLLGDKERAEALKAKMSLLDKTTTCTSKNIQLNHYFSGGDINKLLSTVINLFQPAEQAKLKKTIEQGADFSVRTRQKDNEVLLVVKASLDEGTSANTVTRLEFEEAVTITLEELDKLVLSAGYIYQAKWSREREEYSYKNANVCIDKNAGYGYLAEFEKISDKEEDLATIRQELTDLMSELGVVELPQDRLARMFTHYNANWEDYYGTDRTFSID